MIAISDHKVLIGKEEYLPFSAEIHYFRVPKRYWSICFERIRRAGFKIISTIVPWNLHEDENRDFDFSGFSDQTKDLIVFIELAREFGFKMILRPGPFILSEWDRHGLPKFLDKYPEVFALDSEGGYVRPAAGDGVQVANYPSINNPRYMNFVKHYFNGLTEIIKNYIYPRGPVFMIELGSDNFFGGNFEPRSADYNEYTMKQLYPEFLEAKYQEIKHFNKAYGLKLKEFAEIAELEELNSIQDHSLATRMDWLKFKEYLQVNYLSAIKDLYLSFSCNPLFLSTVSFRANVQPPMNDFPSQEEEPKIMGVRLTWNDSSSDLLQKVRYLAANSDFSFATELSVGMSSAEPIKSKSFFPVSEFATRYMLTLALAGGIKGFNANMFVERDHWYDAALANDGTIQPSYDVLKHFSAAAMQIDFGAFDSVTNVGVVSYKNHSSLELFCKGTAFAYIENLVYSTLPGIGRDLDRLKIDYKIPELTNSGSLEKYKTLIIPVSEYMDAAEQELLVEKIKAGVNIIFVGLMPRYDTNGSACNILSAFLRLKSSTSFEVAEIKYNDSAFPTLLYGTLSSTDSQMKTIAKAGKSVVAVKSNKYKGLLAFVSFDLSTQYYHTKMSFLESLLADCQVTPFIYTSNPDVRAIVRTDKKRALLFVLYSRPQLPFKRMDRHPLQVAIKVDLKQIGIKTAKLRMTELFSGEKDVLTSKKLSTGIITDLHSLDSRVWLIAPALKSSAE
jgi:beta-galactosidase